MANSLWVFTLTLFMVRCVPDPRTHLGVKLLSAVLFGIGLSSRVHFLLVGPPVLSALVQTAGWGRALKFMSVAALACLVVTAPFYLYDPQGFTPLHPFTKLDSFEGLLPLARWVVPIVGGGLALALSFQSLDEKRLVLYRSCAIVLASPVVCTVLLSSVREGGLELEKFAWYGESFMFFAALVCWIKLTEEIPPIARKEG